MRVLPYLLAGAVQVCCVLVTMLFWPARLVAVFSTSLVVLLVVHLYFLRWLPADVKGWRGYLLQLMVGITLTALWGTVGLVVVFDLAERAGWH